MDKTTIFLIILSVFAGVMAISYFVLYTIYGRAAFVRTAARKAKAKGYARINKHKKSGQIVFFGDSLTEMYELDKYFPNTKIYNRGISGDTTSGMIARLKSNVLNIKPKTIFFLGGANDLNLDLSVEEIAQNIATIIGAIRKELPKIDIYVQSVYPFNKEYKMAGVVNLVAHRKNEDVIKLNELIRYICCIYKVQYIDMHKYLVENDILNPEYTLDGLHLNAKGYELVTSVLAKYI